MLYKSNFLTLETMYIVGIYLDEYWFVGPSGRFTHGYVILDYIGLFGTGLYMGRAPRTKETLPNFRERCRVTRHSRVFPRVDE